MNRIFSSGFKSFAAACLLAAGLAALGAVDSQAQVVQKYKKLPKDLIVAKPDLKVTRFTGVWRPPYKALTIGGEVKNDSNAVYEGNRVVFLYSFDRDGKERLADTVRLPARMQPGETINVRFRPIEPKSVQTFNFKMVISGSDVNPRNDSATTNVSEV